MTEKILAHDPRISNRRNEKVWTSNAALRYAEKTRTLWKRHTGHEPSMDWEEVATMADFLDLPRQLFAAPLNGPAPAPWDGKPPSRTPKKTRI